MEKYTEQEITRRNSLKELISLGINPYPADEFLTNTTSEEIKNQYSSKIPHPTTPPDEPSSRPSPHCTLKCQ